MRSALALLVIALTLLGATPHVAAQGYPSGTITLVIPLSPGDGADVAGRAMAEELAKLLKVAVVPVNRPGAGMAIGTDGQRVLNMNDCVSFICELVGNPDDLRHIGLMRRINCTKSRGRSGFCVHAVMHPTARSLPATRI